VTAWTAIRQALRPSPRGGALAVPALPRRLAVGRRERDRLAAALREILERNHDAASALSTALLDAQFLARGACASEDERRDVTSELAASLLRLRDLLDETTRLARSGRRSG